MRQVELDTPRVDTHAPAGSVVLWHTKLMHAAVRRPCVVGGAVQCSVVQCTAVEGRILSPPPTGLTCCL